jgi:hypothetical protein
MEKPLFFNSISKKDIDEEIVAILTGKKIFETKEKNENQENEGNARMKKVWNLGKESWGRSIFIFHLNDNLVDFVDVPEKGEIVDHSSEDKVEEKGEIEALLDCKKKQKLF